MNKKWKVWKAWEDLWVNVLRFCVAPFGRWHLIQHQINIFPGGRKIKGGGHRWVNLLLCKKILYCAQLQYYVEKQLVRYTVTNEMFKHCQTFLVLISPYAPGDKLNCFIHCKCLRRAMQTVLLLFPGRPLPYIYILCIGSIIFSVFFLKSTRNACTVCSFNQHVLIKKT